MKRDELKQLIQGVILGAPTPFDDEFHVDHGRMAELTQWWVEKGAVTGKAVLMVASLMGETLSYETANGHLYCEPWCRRPRARCRYSAAARTTKIPCAP